MVQETSRC